MIDSEKNNPIVVIGDFILDSYIEGSSTRISPEAPIPVLDTQKKYSKLGGGLNVVNNLINLNRIFNMILYQLKL